MKQIMLNILVALLKGVIFVLFKTLFNRLLEYLK